MAREATVDDEPIASLPCERIELAAGDHRIRLMARAVAVAAGLGIAVAIAGPSVGLGDTSYWLGVPAAAIHLAATFVAWRTATRSTPRTVDATTLSLHRGRAVSWTRQAQRGSVHHGRWVGGWFDGTRLGFSLDDGSLIMATAQDRELARDAWRSLGLPRLTFERRLAAGTPWQRLWRALVFPYLFGLVASYAAAHAWVGLYVIFLSFAMGPLGWVVGLALLAALGALLTAVGGHAGSMIERLGDVTLVVGRDGVRVRRRGSPDWMLRHPDVRSYAAWQDRVVVNTANGNRMEFLAATERDAVSVAASIEELRAELLRAGTAGAQAATEVIPRRDRGVGQWLGQLRKLVQNGEQVGYRAASPDPAPLLDCLVHPFATVEQRLGAAVALGASGDPELVDRVRIAAGGLADEELRAAIEHAAVGELHEADAARVLRTAPGAGRGT
jgi:hypothetical protein